LISIPQGISLAIQLVTKEIDQLRNKKLVIALDGHSSSGKSTLSKDLSKLLHIPHIDSGAMYRAVTLYCLEHSIDPTDVSQVTKALPNIIIGYADVSGHKAITLNGINVEEKIRAMEVSEHVSHIAAISSVRSELVKIQRSLAVSTGVVMDGRDIGSVVLPYADVKLYVTADIEVRTKRRHQELTEHGDHITVDMVRQNLLERDHIDSNRNDSPLVQATDAILLDTSDLDRSSMLTQAVQIIHSRMIEGQDQ
jgi:CMP/dCMP kinase